MRLEKDCKIREIPIHNIVFVSTSSVDYEMSRTLFVENWPDFGNYAILDGSHCSCYDFDETTWDATIFDDEKGWKANQDDLQKVIRERAKRDWGEGARVAKMVMAYFGWKEVPDGTH